MATLTSRTRAQGASIVTTLPAEVVRRLGIPAGQELDWRRGAAGGPLVGVLAIAADVATAFLAQLLPRGPGSLVRAAVVCALLVPSTALAIAAGVKLTFRRGRPQLGRIGLAPPQRVLSSLLLFVPAVVIATYVGIVLTVLAGLQDEPTTSIDLDGRSPGVKLYISFASVVLAPWVEELAFRGLAYSSLALRFGFWPAALISSLLWSGLHLALGVLIVFTLEGVVLCWLRRRTGSVMPGVGIHGCWNALVSGVSGGGVFAAITLGIFAFTVAAAVRGVRMMVQ